LYKAKVDFDEGDHPRISIRFASQQVVNWY